jgi:serine O-acetyltransferase
MLCFRSLCGECNGSFDNAAGTFVMRKTNDSGSDPLWQAIRQEVAQQAQDEPILARFLHATILNHATLEEAVSFHLAAKLESSTLPAMLIREVIEQALREDGEIGQALRADIRAVRDRDPAAQGFAAPLLYFKGFHALQSYRVAHWLWTQGRRSLAWLFQNRISEVFAADIHPGARIGRGVMFDHGTGLVIGETVVMEDNVSVMQEVTLGGTGKETGDRHPKVRRCVLIGAGAKILGNIEIGVGAKVGAGSVVLHPVPPHRTVAGVPARLLGRPKEAEPALAMDHRLPDSTSDNGPSRPSHGRQVSETDCVQA